MLPYTPKITNCLHMPFMTTVHCTPKYIGYKVHLSMKLSPDYFNLSNNTEQLCQLLTNLFYKDNNVS